MKQYRILRPIVAPAPIHPSRRPCRANQRDEEDFGDEDVNAPFEPAVGVSGASDGEEQAVEGGGDPDFEPDSKLEFDEEPEIELLAADSEDVEGDIGERWL